MKKEDYKALCDALAVQRAKVLVPKDKPLEYYKLAEKEIERLISLLPEKARARWEKKLCVILDLS